MIIKYKTYFEADIEEQISGIEVIDDNEGFYLKCLRTQSNPWYRENDPYFEVEISQVYYISP